MPSAFGGLKALSTGARYRPGDPGYDMTVLLACGTVCLTCSSCPCKEQQRAAERALASFTHHAEC